MFAGGHAWLLGGVWLPGGMRSCQGACMVARGCVVAGGHAWLLGVCKHGCQRACMVAGGHAWLPRGHAWLPGVCMVAGSVRRIRRDTVNERAVRILLECILVKTIFSQIY